MGSLVACPGVRAGVIRTCTLQCRRPCRGRFQYREHVCPNDVSPQALELILREVWRDSESPKVAQQLLKFSTPTVVGPRCFPSFDHSGPNFFPHWPELPQLRPSSTKFNQCWRRTGTYLCQAWAQFSQLSRDRPLLGRTISAFCSTSSCVGNAWPTSCQACPTWAGVSQTRAESHTEQHVRYFGATLGQLVGISPGSPRVTRSAHGYAIV